jgi:hypothetical protein
LVRLRELMADLGPELVDLADETGRTCAHEAAMAGRAEALRVRLDICNRCPAATEPLGYQNLSRSRPHPLC